MKNRLLLFSGIINLMFLSFLMYSFSNDDNTEITQKYFIAEYTTGDSWNQEIDFFEQKYAGHHSRFLSSLRREGLIELGARYADKGIIVFTSTDLNSAKKLMESDTAVTQHLFNVEVNELSFFYEGCINTQLRRPEQKNNKVTGIGGVFFKCKDPKALKEWYKTHLGFDTDQYGTNFEWRQGADPTKYGFTQWSPFSEKTTYFAPSTREFMINYRVENLEELVAQLRKEGVTITDSLETYDYGKFIHILDVEGNKIELWEPNDVEYYKIVGGRTK